MSNKGFTLIELITTFALFTVIAVLLINVLISIRNLYYNTSVKTELYINQSNLSKALNSKIKNGEIVKRAYCEVENSLACYDFTFINGETERLVVKEKQIVFGKYTYNLDEKAIARDVYESDFNGYWHFKISISNEIYPDIDFGVNLVYAT